MPRPKAQSWRQPGIDDANVDEICTDDFFDKILAKHFCTMSEALKARVVRQIRSALRLFRLKLISRDRPTGGEKRKALAVLIGKLSDARDALETLDSDSRRLIEEASTLDQTFRGFISPTFYEVESGGKRHEITDRYGKDHLVSVFEHIEAALKWTHAAARQVSISKAGKTTQEAEASAVQKLRDIWRDLNHSRDPSEVQLLSFASDCLDPILRLSGRNAQLSGHVHQALFGQTLRPGEK